MSNVLPQTDDQMSKLLYSITTGGGLALSVDKRIGPGPGGATLPLILADPNTDDPDQQWNWVYNEATNSHILYNPGRNWFAKPMATIASEWIILAEIEAFTTSNTFQITGTSNAAVQCAANTELNMSAGDSAGDPPHAGSAITLRGWDGGQPYEEWNSNVIGHR